MIKYSDFCDACQSGLLIFDEIISKLKCNEFDFSLIKNNKHSSNYLQMCQCYKHFVFRLNSIYIQADINIDAFIFEIKEQSLFTLSINELNIIGDFELNSKEDIINTLNKVHKNMEFL